MSVFIDRKYLLLVSSKLRNFKDKGNDLYNFSCNFCGDSSTNKLKARGYVFRKADNYFYMCHNCQVSMGFAKFLRETEPSQYKSYLLERYGENKKTIQPRKSNNVVLIGQSPHQKFSDQSKNDSGNELNKKHSAVKINLDSIDKLNKNHPAREYIQNRLIPEVFWKDIYYAEDFKIFMDQNFPDHGKDLIDNDPRLVLFYRNRSGTITNVAGRSLVKDDPRLRYITIKVSEEKKVFGLERVDLKKTIYVVEGQFDSFFLPNCVASGDSNLIGTGDYLYSLRGSKHGIVLVYDNEDRNTNNIKQMYRAIKEGYAISLFPKTVAYKDINDMVMGGYSPEEIEKIVDENTFAGLKAELNLTAWRKI